MNPQVNIGLLHHRRFLRVLAGCMLLMYVAGNIAYQWNQIGHTIYHISTQTDFRHVHHASGTDDTLGEEHQHASWVSDQFVMPHHQAYIAGLEGFTFLVFKHLPAKPLAEHVIQRAIPFIYTHDLLLALCEIVPETPPPRLG